MKLLPACPNARTFPSEDALEILLFPLAIVNCWSSCLFGPILFPVGGMSQAKTVDPSGPLKVRTGFDGVSSRELVEARRQKHAEATSCYDDSSQRML